MALAERAVVDPLREPTFWSLLVSTPGMSYSVRPMRKASVFVLSVVVVGVALAAPSGRIDLKEISTEVSEEREANRLRTLEYSWTTRTELKLGAETRRLTTETVRYTSDGELEKTPVGDQLVPKKTKSKKMANRQEWGAKLLALLDGYTLTTRDEIYSFLSTSTLTHNERPGMIKLHCVGVVQPSDTMTWWVDAKSRDLMNTEVRANLDTLDIEMDTDYARTADGLSYIARSVVRVPVLGVVLTVENSDYNKQ